MHAQDRESSNGAGSNTQQLQQHQGIEMLRRAGELTLTPGLRSAPAGAPPSSAVSTTAATAAPADALQLPESLDLSRLLASVGSALLSTGASTTSAADSHRSNGPGTVAPEGVVVAVVGGVGTRLPADTAPVQAQAQGQGQGQGLQLRDLGLGGDAAPAPPSGAGHGAQSQPLPFTPAQSLSAPWSGWLQPHIRAQETASMPGGRSRIIAVTAPDRQEVMLAISKPDP